MKHKGFSLIECILVIAVMAIVVSVSVGGLIYLDSANANKCASAIDSAIATAKSETLSKAEPGNLYLYEYDGRCYVKFSKAADFVRDANAERVDAGRVEISYDDGTGVKALAGNDPLMIAFSRKDGSFTSGPQTIYVNGSDTYEIRFIRNTGKHIMKMM
ncbi:MAG: prepilin-type N-terminal cleavage/methylation domain-containing protein [Lachnoclostridium sp.]|jgi:prepilin-type N-terminal cleavage/methylation domain-containing protein|nr:prepilin-type N-terminal cleavage/methylation domain-containing protein [Lachnoclostridium sp.]